ncbi:MAG TPA: hypothetical protein VGB17_08300 [Pyrinomonadaceae bacterium]|jgi:hypothetical protein
MLSLKPLHLESQHSLGANLLKATLVLLTMALAASGAWLGAQGAKSGMLAAERKELARQRRSNRLRNHAPGSWIKESGESKEMSEPSLKIETPGVSAPFYKVLSKALKKRKLKLEAVCPFGDSVSRRVLEDYGAVYVASSKVLPPPVCMFLSEEEVKAFQERAGFTSALIDYAEIELQPEAMKQLLKAREQANKEGLDITPRGGSEAARRNYEDTLRLWDTRFLPALSYWNEKGRLSAADVERLRRLPLREQVAQVLELEKSGIFFSKDFSKSILYSIAAPGASQHIAMLALDVTEFENPRVREILAEHGWFQTVLSDLPHFTFLGHKEKDLPKHGLRPVISGNQLFWIPNIEREAD